jgi:hypothetical protein
MASSITPRENNNIVINGKAKFTSASPTLPEFKKISDLAELYSAFT